MFLLGRSPGRPVAAFNKKSIGLQFDAFEASFNQTHANVHRFDVLFIYN